MLNTPGMFCSQTWLWQWLCCGAAGWPSKSQQGPGHNVKTACPKGETFSVFGVGWGKHRWIAFGKNWLLPFMGINSSPGCLVCDGEQGDPCLNKQYYTLDFLILIDLVLAYFWSTLELCISVSMLPPNLRNHCGNKFTDNFSLGPSELFGKNETKQRIKW